MEHIGNYLDKYRHMIAEYDEMEAISKLGELGRQLEVVALEQGKAITRLEKVCQEALTGLDKLMHEDN